MLLIMLGIFMYFATPSKKVELHYSYRIIDSFPHDPQAFTQGLVYYNGYLYEGTGLYGSSSLRQVSLEEGLVLRQKNLPAEYFGEGITIADDRIIQLTWQENTGFVYDAVSFDLIDRFSYDTEGWGLTYDGHYLIMSDGTSQLTYLDPMDYQPVKYMSVVSNEGPVENLNELEFINGVIYANVWLTDKIVMIDSDDGNVIGWINMEGLLNEEEKQAYSVDVLNGIAYDAKADRLLVTGKLWPQIYHIELIKGQAP